MNTKQFNIKFLIISGIILLPIIFFPISPDLSAFLQGGKILADGGELYKDFFDLKPPLIYYLFSLLAEVTGGSILFIRLFDLLYQLLFIFSAFVIFNRLGLNSIISNIFSVVFASSYTILNYSNTLECETFAFLPIIWYFYFSISKGNSTKNILIKGVLLGAIISLKYSLGIVLIADLFLQLYYNKENNRVIINFLLQLLTGTFILFLTFLPTIINGNFHHFLTVVEYLKTYSQYPALDISFIKDAIKKIGHIFGDLYTFSFSFFAFFALIKGFSQNSKESKVIIYSFVFFLLFFLSFLIEKRLLMYQFTRVYPFLILLTSIGIYYLVKSYNKINQKFILLIFIGLFLVLSPLPRLANILRVPHYYITDESKYIKMYSDESGLKDLDKNIYLANYINQFDGDFILINNLGNEAVHFLDRDYKFKFPHSSFYLSEYNGSERSLDEFFNSLKNCEFFAVQINDNVTVKNADSKSSFEQLQDFKHISQYIESNFILDTLIGNSYKVYKKADQN